MKRGPVKIKVLTLVAGPMCAIALAAPAVAATGHPAAPAQRAHAAGVTPDSKKPALAGYFSNTGEGRNYDSAGGMVTGKMLGTGQDEITFAGLGGITSGNAQVTVAQGDRTCSVASWTPDGPDLDVFVDCYDYAGSPGNSFFSLIVTQPRSAPHGVLDFDRVTRTARSYALRGKYQYNSSHGKNAVKHLGTGRYLVAMQGPPPSGTGTVKVSAFGAGPGDCQLARWNGTKAGTLIYVDCYSDTGKRQNRQFVVTYARNNNLMGRNGKTDANATATRARAGVYQPKPQFDSHRGARVTQARITQGVYFTLFAGSQGPEASSQGGDVQVTTEGSRYLHCYISNWDRDFTPTADIECLTNGDRDANTGYTIQWVVA